jgi:hypothetical protein
MLSMVENEAVEEGGSVRERGQEEARQRVKRKRSKTKKKGEKVPRLKL